MGLKITRAKFALLLQRTGERVAGDIAAAVPERSIIMRNDAPTGPTVTRDELVRACAVTAGVVVGTMLDVLSIEIVDDAPKSEPS